MVPAQRAICWAFSSMSPSRPIRVTASPGARPGTSVMSMVVTSMDTAPMTGTSWPPAITLPRFDMRCGTPSA